MPKYDFSGWATKNDILCTDGRTIRKDAFKDCDGKKVPLVYMHDHKDPTNVLGHAILENRDEGVYAYCSFNNSAAAQDAKEAVQHGDIDSLSIYANQLKQQGGNVIHGVIREVSLVLAGANIGALIDCPILAHGDNASEEEAIIYSGELFELAHADDEQPETTDKTGKPAEEVVEHADDSKEPEAPSESEEKEVKMAENNETVQDVFNSLNEKQKTVMYYIIGEMMKNKSGGETEMKHNAFENDTPEFTITHEDRKKIFARAQSLGSLKQACEEAMEDGGVLTHAVTDENGNEVTYGIANLNYLFPDYEELNDKPDFIRRDNDWVTVFNAGVHKTPFARVKTTHANITMDEARAKGYTKGKRKEEEVFLLLRRQVDPQTIYKKQKFDRDDIIDVSNNFDIIPWVKAEMQDQLKEEIARASLIGDGRNASDPDKIFPSHIKPVYTDDPLYTIRIKTTKGATNEDTAKNALKDIIRKRKLYKGSGNLVAFMSEDWLSEFLLLEDGFGHPLYKDEQELARKMRVSKIVTVPQLEGLQNTETDETTSTTTTYDCVCIMLDLKDYNWGSNRLGETSFFDDFDIDFNQYKYLYETRLSGMLIKPYSAMVVEVPAA